MGRKPKYSVEEKIKAVEDVLIRKKSKNSVVKGLGTGLGLDKLNYWIAQYKAYGPDGLRTHQRNNRYTEEDRLMAFEYIRAGKSESEVSRMLLIPYSVIRKWVRCYNNPTKVESSMVGKGGKGVPKQHHDFGTMLKATKECMERGIAAARPWHFLGDISAACGDYAHANGYSVVTDLGGHGVGKDFHLEPFVAHEGDAGTGMLLVPGMVLTVEPMINQGRKDVYVDSKDNWTVRTKDKKLSAQWEKTILITETGAEVLSS